MTDDTNSALEQFQQESSAVAMSLLATIETQQRINNGAAENGMVRFNVPAILTALSFVTARLIDIVDDEDQRMKYTSYFDNAYITAIHNNEVKRRNKTSDNSQR